MRIVGLQWFWVLGFTGFGGFGFHRGTGGLGCRRIVGLERFWV